MTRATTLRRLALAAAGLVAAAAANAASVVEEWTSVAAPPAPQLKDVKLEPGTVLLMLDFQSQNCGRRPRCMASVPQVKLLLTRARATGVPVIYSIVPNSTVADILADLTPAPGETWVQSGANKFIGTTLEALLKERGAKAVIPVGTAAEGAVLATGSHAAYLGMNVILPVDGLSSAQPYPEQYTVWHMGNAPGVAQRTTLTAIGRIAF